MKDTFLKERMDENHPNFQQCCTRENTLYKRGNSIRSEFERDYTRLLHCQAYRRMKHKTQVFYAPHNDHICTRIEHVTHVSSVATTLAKFLGLNRDLTEAIAIGHDIGHAPFGHTGEDILNSLIKNQPEAKNAPKKFWHERNSLFFADYIETLPDPNGVERTLDLTYAVRDGLICHCGEIDQQGLKPRTEAINLYDIKRPGFVSPYTWEGCVVKLSDKIAFLGRDLEDAQSYHIIDMACQKELREIVTSTLGFGPNKEASSHTTNGVHRSGRAVNTSVLINDMIVDLCENSSIESGLSFSEPYFNFILALKKFSFNNIYCNWRLKEFSKYAGDVLGGIYRTLIQTQEYAKNGTLPQCLDFAPNLLATFEDWLVKYTNYRPKGDEDRKETLHYDTRQVFDVFDPVSFEKCVIEYISGMTDQFAIAVYEEIISF